MVVVHHCWVSSLKKSIRQGAMTLLQKSFHWQFALECYESHGSVDVTEVVVEVLQNAARWEALMEQLEKMQQEMISIMSQV